MVTRKNLPRQPFIIHLGSPLPSLYLNLVCLQYLLCCQAWSLFQRVMLSLLLVALLKTVAVAMVSRGCRWQWFFPQTSQTLYCGMIDSHTVEMFDMLDNQHANWHKHPPTYQLNHRCAADDRLRIR